MTPRESMKACGRTLSVLALVLFFLTPGCITEPDSVDNDPTNVLIQIVSMLGESQEPAGGAGEGSDLFSDVCFQQPDDLACTFFNDNGIVTMRAIPKDATQPIGQMTDVIFERYRVSYIRADGRNVAGTDVPYTFDGAANFRVPSDGADTPRAFVVVRHQAKIESPLRELQSNFGGTLSVLAQVDFYGHDTAGRPIQATGYLNITFANFANE